MKTIYLLDSKTIDYKYIKDWQNNIEDMLVNHIQRNGIQKKVVTLYDVDLNGLALIDDTPLTYKDIISQQTKMMEKITRMFETGQIKDRDHFVFFDAWNPIIFQIKYLAVAFRMKVIIHGFWHMGSFNKTSYLYFTTDRTWLRNTEKALVAAIDHNYYDTDYHYGLIKALFKSLGPRNMINAQSKMIKAGPPMEHVLQYAKEFEGTKKRDMIVFPDRAVPHRQLAIFKELQLALPQYEWVCVHERALNKQQYHGILASAKYIFSADTTDSACISSYEAIMHKCIPMVPNRLNFTEVVPDKWRYPSEWTLDYAAYTLHYNEIIDYIKDRMENYDKYSVGIEEVGKELSKNYFNISNFKELMFLYK